LALSVGCRGMIELFPAKCHDEILCCSVCGRVLSWIITTPWLSMPRRLFWIARHNFCSVSQQTPVLIVEPWGRKSTSRMPFLSQNIVHMTFRVEVVCLNFVFVGDDACLHSINCCFNSGLSCDTHVSSPATTLLKKFSPSSCGTASQQGRI